MSMLNYTEIVENALYYIEDCRISRTCSRLYSVTFIVLQY